MSFLQVLFPTKALCVETIRSVTFENKYGPRPGLSKSIKVEGEIAIPFNSSFLLIAAHCQPV